MHAGAAQTEKSPEKAEATTTTTTTASDTKESGAESDNELTKKSMKQQEDPEEEKEEKEKPTITEDKTSETSSSKRPPVKEEEDKSPADDTDDISAGAPPASKKAKVEGDSAGSSLLVEEASAQDKPVTFPAKLMALLQQQDTPEGIYWLPSGDIFAMHTEKMDNVLVKHFQGTKFMSFTRTLNKWGFRKALGLSLPPKTVAYQHESFLRDEPEKAKTIVNHSKGGGKGRSKKSQAAEISGSGSTGQGASAIVTGTPSDGGAMPGSIGFVGGGGPMQNPAQFNSMLMQQFGGGVPGFMGAPGFMQQQQPQDIRNQNMLFQSLMGQQQHQNPQFFQQMQGGIDPTAQHQFAAQQFFFQQNPFFQQQQQQMQLQQQQQQQQQQGNSLDTYLRTVGGGQNTEEEGGGGGADGGGDVGNSEQNQNTELSSGGDGPWDP